MISKEAEAFHDKWRALAAGDPDAPPPTDSPDIAALKTAFATLSSSLGSAIPSTTEEVRANGVRALWFTPEGVTGSVVVLYLHGGAFVSCSPETHANIAMHLAKRLNGRALSVDYRLTPESVFPAQIEDCLTVYEWLLEQGIPANQIVFAGESAGGSLVVTTQLLGLQRDLPLPAAAYIMSPWLDLEATADSYDTIDADLAASREATLLFGGMYIGPGVELDRDNPLMSPLRGSLAGLAPAYVQVGGDERASDDARLLVANLHRDGIEAELDVTPEMQHMFQMNVGVMPEAESAVDRGVAFLKRHLE